MSAKKGGALRVVLYVIGAILFFALIGWAVWLWKKKKTQPWQTDKPEGGFPDGNRLTEHFTANELFGPTNAAAFGPETNHYKQGVRIARWLEHIRHERGDLPFEARWSALWQGPAVKDGKLGSYTTVTAKPLPGQSITDFAKLMSQLTQDELQRIGLDGAEAQFAANETDTSIVIPIWAKMLGPDLPGVQ